ncbi:unnamed protein product [Periconia digitata]|uniref:Uncharacterized protein n=1 Tax=Periconia digitata TaxID=1303443 RepID=A0A9W4UR55_9PLEO|nr:unnamed protein product [Periconia digitata]
MGLSTPGPAHTVERQRDSRNRETEKNEKRCASYLSKQSGTPLLLSISLSLSLARSPGPLWVSATDGDASSLRPSLPVKLVCQCNRGTDCHEQRHVCPSLGLPAAPLL